MERWLRQQSAYHAKKKDLSLIPENQVKEKKSRHSGLAYAPNACKGGKVPESLLVSLSDSVREFR